MIFGMEYDLQILLNGEIQLIQISSHNSCVVVFSLYWTSPTQTAQPTVKPLSSIRRTNVNMRRECRPSWSRAGSTLNALTELHNHKSTGTFDKNQHVCAYLFFLTAW